MCFGSEINILSAECTFYWQMWDFCAHLFKGFLFDVFSLLCVPIMPLFKNFVDASKRVLSCTYWALRQIFWACKYIELQTLRRRKKIFPKKNVRTRIFFYSLNENFHRMAMKNVGNFTFVNLKGRSVREALWRIYAKYFLLGNFIRDSSNEISKVLIIYFKVSQKVGVIWKLTLLVIEFQSVSK